MRTAVALLGLILLLSVTPARAAPPSIHLVVADSLCDLTGTNAQAFVLGIVSHSLLHLTVQETVFNWRDGREWSSHADLIASELLTIRLFLYKDLDIKDKWAMFGALLPDIIDGIYALANPEAWEKGVLIIPWHCTF